jgi:hypothetical protein
MKDARKLLSILNAVWLAFVLAVGAATGFLSAGAGTLVLFLILLAAPALALVAARTRSPTIRATAVGASSAVILLALIGIFSGTFSWPLLVFFLPACVNVAALPRPGERPVRVLAEAALALNAGALIIVVYRAATKLPHQLHTGLAVWMMLFAAICVIGLATLFSTGRALRRGALALNVLAPALVLHGVSAGWVRTATPETLVFMVVFFLTAAVNLLAALREA